AEALSPGVPSTLRLLTLWDLDTGLPFVAAAAQRVHRPGRGPCDAFSGGDGALSVPVDRESGELGLAVGSDARGRRATWEVHPETGVPITGARVPGWEQVASLVLGAARAFPHAPFLGWDLLLDREGGVQLLEANPAPGTIVWQVHEPLLADPRSRRFFTALGMA
ncbi:MAG: sugar-transfer associated ATP-grasp domain-containing protein, partial [Thermoanaerobaculia bacterium]|nr:sugar-transfer associated ATP-grasp domain-containing protein [Thermoanaerobaculia bacterium]